eukprot:gnl/MRDRNA2_/MRDRNA2_207998_c0_seq1.p1 gnl/MRDRNA2_/MRDRNA2_207998_c0~~gnl/MRDRNA2_/MRDRNA2_207998_c0_seq1.p1  ORF type:complete len:102 (-),score=7.55 gnl/MRDRNA2_/MRDRNA2_207998_c0_seq1:56-361(-)
MMKVVVILLLSSLGLVTPCIQTGMCRISDIECCSGCQDKGNIGCDGGAPACIACPPGPKPAPECNPKKTCTVCGACCADYISDGDECQKCEKEKCTGSIVV